ncbi:hypothetical protein SPF06_19780 [Sinomonas sp. JGH33]|uniref:Uncharacterized protein n=1 Tax=Sinomonas terricola TaxID=3110330 RepID=A0ABU5TBA4_9MICC|nr:hypothetical protein [Sinomonas sp. JGH33]MEA5456969.1 hypothetical protein [Sinomonas sp. JGH33]
MDYDIDPFAGIEDEAELSPSETRKTLFVKAKLGYARIEKVFVQLDDYPQGGDSRGSVLGHLVTAKKARALDLLLTVHALANILDGSPLPLVTWAKLLSPDGQEWKVRTISTAFRELQEMDLLELSGSKQQPVVLLKREDGSGEPMPELKSENGRGFFTVPFDYWTDGAITKLSLPAKAMLLIILKETQDPKGKLTFTMPVARAKNWYGISERSAERGYLELVKEGLISQKIQKVSDPQHPAGRREIVHRAPVGVYSTAHRERLRHLAEAAADAASKGS